MNKTIDYSENPVSGYAPSPEISEFTAEVKKDYAIGHDILTKSWNELNEMSVLDDMNNGRRMFNAFVDDSADDPMDAWKWRGTRSMARNKGIAMHANLTAAYIVPTFLAQNQDQEVDRDFSEFMQEICEWMIENSDYKSNFLSLVTAMETDPIVYLGAEFQEVYQTIKTKTEDGGYTKKEILDDVLSGFKAPIYTADQILLNNAYERNIQRQKCIIKREWIEYGEAEAKYGKHEYWPHVKAGFACIYNEDDGLFYDIKDQDHPSLVEEVTYLHRRKDIEACFLGGIYMGDKNVEHNPMKHRDNFDAPKYNIVDFGFHSIGSHFIFRKSMMNSMRWDNNLYDAMSEMVMNRAMLEVDPPVAVTGVDNFDDEVVFPNAVTTFENPEARVQKILPDSNLQAGFNALKATEESMSESAAVNEVAMGNLPPASQKAYIVAQAQAASQKIISNVAKGLGNSCAQFGSLMADIAISHYSIPQVDEIVGDDVNLKYRSFLLDKKRVGGREMSKRLVFDASLIGAEMTPEEKTNQEMVMLEKSGYPDNKEAIYRINPAIFAKMKYLAKADYKELFPQNEHIMQGQLSALYGQLNADPMIEREALLREMMYSYFQGRGDKFIAKKPGGGLGGLPGSMPGGEGAGKMPVKSAISTAQPVA